VSASKLIATVHTERSLLADPQKLDPKQDAIPVLT